MNDSHGVDEDIDDVVKDINAGISSLNFGDGDGSLQLSVTQSQSVEGTKPVMQAKDVPLQLQLEDERQRKKKSDHLKRKELERRQKAAGVHPVLRMSRNLNMIKGVSRLVLLIMLGLMALTCLRR